MEELFAHVIIESFAHDEKSLSNKLWGFRTIFGVFFHFSVATESCIILYVQMSNEYKYTSCDSLYSFSW